MKRDLVCSLAMSSLLLGAALGCAADSTAGPDPDPDPIPDPVPDPDPPGQPGVWGTPRALHELPGSSRLPVLRVDPAGHALAIWEQTHPEQPHNRLWASRRTSGAWNPPVLVTTASNLGSELAVAGEPDTAHAAWLQYQQDERRIVATHVEPGGTWSTPAVLRTSTWQQGPILQPRVATTGDHAAIVWAWQDPATNRHVLEGRIRGATGTWSPMPPIASDFTIATYARPLYDVAFDDAGAVVVTWVERQTDQIEVRARRGLPVEGSLSVAWEASRSVTTIPGPNLYAMRDLWTGTHAGRSFAAWLRVEADDTMTLSASHLRPDGIWAAEQSTQHIRSSHYAPPRFAAGADGHKVVLWREPLAESSRIIARTFDPELGWGGDQIIADGLMPPYLGCIDIDAHFLDVSIDDAGNAIALWEERLPDPDAQPHGRSRLGVWSSQLIAGAGWQPPSRIDGELARFAGKPLAALATGSIGVALFDTQADDGQTSLAVNELAPAPATP